MTGQNRHVGPIKKFITRAEVLPPQTEKFLLFVPSLLVWTRAVWWFVPSTFFTTTIKQKDKKKNHNNPALTFLPALCLKTATHKLEVTWKTTEVTTVEDVKGKTGNRRKNGKWHDEAAWLAPDVCWCFLLLRPEALNLTVRSVNVFLLQQTVRRRPARRPKINSLLVCRDTRIRTATLQRDPRVTTNVRHKLPESQSVRAEL